MTRGRPCTMLLVDDHADDRISAIAELTRAFPGAVVNEIVDARGLAAALAANGFDLVITDSQLKWSDGLAVLRAVKDVRPDCPVIMFTGTGTQETAVEAMKAGLDDYIVKAPGHDVRLSAAARTALERAESRRRAAHLGRRLHGLLESLDVGVFRASLDGRLIEANPAFLRLIGAASLTDAQARGLGQIELPASERERLLHEPSEARRPHEREVYLDRPDGRARWLRVSETICPRPRWGGGRGRHRG